MTTRINLWNRASGPTQEKGQSPTEPNRVEAGEWERAAEPDYDEEPPIPENPPGNLGSIAYRGNRPQRRQSRTGSISICLSADEEAILRAHAMKLDTSFSEWARKVLFRSLGRKPPRRLLPE